MGLFIHFYIIFGTNLLTGGPAQIAVFFLLQCFAEKEYQRGPNGMKLSGELFLEQTWSRGLGVDVAPSTLVGPSWLHRPTSSSYIYLRTPKLPDTKQKPHFHRRNLLYPWDPILGPVPELCRRGIDHGGLLHQHHSLSDEVWVVYFRPSGP